MNSTLDSLVLVLNKYFQPIHVIGTKDAMRLICSDKASVVYGDYDVFDLDEWEVFSQDKEENLIRTPTRKFVAPEVIRLLDYDRCARYTINFTRENLFLRDNFQCQYCGSALARREMTVDHVIPQSRQSDFGMTRTQIQAWDNLVVACIPCNSKKGNKTPTEASMSLLNEPSCPKWLGNVRGIHTRNVRPSWRAYLESLKGSK